MQLARGIYKELEYGLDIRDSFDKLLMEKLRDIMVQLSRTYSPTSYETMENMKESDDMKFVVADLEKNPDELMEAAKHLMKKSLFEENTRMGGASNFPYPYCYVVSTCAVPDLNY